MSARTTGSDIKFTSATPPDENDKPNEDTAPEDNIEDGKKDTSQDDNPGGLGYIIAPDGKRVPVLDYPAYERDMGF